MLTASEKEYLEKIPDDRIVMIQPYDPKMEEVAATLMQEIHVMFPEVTIHFLGASALKISGQGDIDLYVCSPKEKFEKYLPTLTSLFGDHVANTSTFEWQFVRDGFQISVYLTDPATDSMKRHIAVFTLLKNSPELQKEYELIKESMNGKSLREYQRAKYEFYHKILPREYRA